MILISFIIVLVFPLTIKGGQIITPGMIFFSVMTIFWIYQLLRYDPSKEFTGFQRTMIFYSPLYGFLTFYLIWRLMRLLIFKESFS